MTSKTLTKTEFTIQTLQDEHIKSAVDLFARSFCTSEPITKHLGITYRDYLPFATEVVHKAINDGMSKVAVNKFNQVIALAIAEDITEPFIPKLNHYPKLKPVLALLHELSKKFLSNKEFIRGKIAHVWIAVVDPSVRGQGLSTQIDKAVGDAAARKGFDFAYAEFTNPLSEKIVNQYNLFKLINKIPFENFTYEGEKIFKGLKGNATAYIVVIRPGVKIDSLSHCFKTTET